MNLAIKNNGQRRRLLFFLLLISTIVSGVSGQMQEYILQAGDVIAVNVVEHPEFSGRHKIRPDGRINYPVIGEVEVALVVGKHVFGDGGGRVVGALICIGLVSAISAMMWIGPRVTKVMGEDLPALRFFSRTTSSGVPALAILLQASIVTVLVLTQSFEGVLEFIQFALTLSSFLAVLAVIVLRITRPDLKRTYRTWGYPFTALIFLAVTAMMMIYLLIERPIQSLAGLALLTTGLLVFYLGNGRFTLQSND